VEIVEKFPCRGQFFLCFLAVGENDASSIYLSEIRAPQAICQLLNHMEYDPSAMRLAHRDESSSLLIYGKTEAFLIACRFSRGDGESLIYVTR
jgi:hypothetical protein